MSTPTHQYPPGYWESKSPEERRANPEFALLSLSEPARWRILSLSDRTTFATQGVKSLWKEIETLREEFQVLGYPRCPVQHVLSGACGLIHDAKLNHLCRDDVDGDYDYYPYIGRGNLESFWNELHQYLEVVEDKALVEANMLECAHRYLVNSKEGLIESLAWEAYDAGDGATVEDESGDEEYLPQKWDRQEGRRPGKRRHKR